MKQPAFKHYLRNDMDRAIVMQNISKLNLETEKPLCVRIETDSETRSQKQNRLAFMWYRILGGFTGHGEKYEREYCKLVYGCPILSVDDADFNAFYVQALDVLPYEQRLAAMEYVPVTSLFTVKQFAEYLNTIEQESALRGIQLPRPDDLYYEALIKEFNSRA